MTFPLIENILMSQHALSYSYDRMKAILPLSFLCCEMLEQFEEYSKETRKYFSVMMAGIVLVCSVLNLCLYNNSRTYVWNANYRVDNTVLADYINEHYPDSVLGIGGVPVRGYINLLFGRGIQEGNDDVNFLSQKAAEKGLRYVVIINVDNAQSWNMYELNGATIYDTTNGSKINVSITDDGTIHKYE